MGGNIVKILICGSVDDGKSTFLGKFLYDNKFIHKDLIEEIRNQSHKYGTQGKKIDLALLTDGLQSEREQGITIDVAYRYFYLKKKNIFLQIHQVILNIQKIWLQAHLILIMR